MKPQTIGIILGGLLPALLYGTGGVLQKMCSRAGIGVGLYVACIGLGFVAAGLGVYLVMPDKTISSRSGLLAVALGLCTGVSMGLTAIALVRYQTPLSKLVPLYNMNTLVAVLGALVIFSEWREVSLSRLLMGAVLIVIGGYLVADS